MIGVTTPGGTYYPFVADYLNYPGWIRVSVLFVSEQITHVLGYNSHLIDNTLVNDDHTKTLIMGWPCYGLALMSFWFAFVISHAEPLKIRLKWITIGISTIFLINIIRITLLYISSIDEWAIGSKFNSTNHDLFNYVSYIAIAIILFLYKRKPDPQVIQPINTTAAVA
jgi:exosortase/archaeosortase family protein